MARNDRNVILEDVTIAFRNFAGKADKFNKEGDRNFAIILRPEDAEGLIQNGWNVKFLKAREEGDEPTPYIQVAVSYKTKPPRIGMVTSKSLTYLEEDQVEMLDWVDIETADVTINPYEWVVNDKVGVKAYVKSLFIKIEEDYLQMKWTSIVEESRQIGPSQPDYIDGEIVREIEGEVD